MNFKRRNYESQKEERHKTVKCEICRTSLRWNNTSCASMKAHRCLEHFGVKRVVTTSNVTQAQKYEQRRQYNQNRKPHNSYNKTKHGV